MIWKVQLETSEIDKYTIQRGMCFLRTSGTKDDIGV